MYKTTAIGFEILDQIYSNCESIPELTPTEK